MDFKKVQFYYPFPFDNRENPLLEIIYLDSIENFSELSYLANRIACNKKWPLIIFETEQTKFHFELYKECSQLNDIVDYSESNIISIQNDSIIVNDHIELPFDSVKTVLKNHILNPNGEFNYSKNIEKALIFYHQDSLFSSKKIKTQLVKISTKFNELNREYGDSLPLKIKLSDYPYIRVLNPPLPDE